MSRQSSSSICFDQCHDIVMGCRNKVLSSDFPYILTLTSLLQHLSVNLPYCVAIVLRDVATIFISGLSLA